MKLILIRGLPGSGKTTLAHKLKKRGWKHFETDMYFTRDGEYFFDRSEAGTAHAWCLCQATKAIESKKNVIVANTFTTYDELEPYLDMAEDNDADVEIYCCNGDYGSDHDVPEEVIERMADRWEDIEDEIYIGE